MSSGQAIVVIDAGYLIKALVINARRRSREQIVVDWVALSSMIADLSQAQTGAALLRQTWYDASWFAQPRDEHRQLSAQPGVHVRLGWLVRTDRGLAQKAVDSQIVRDLVVAAHEQNVDQVVILGGDGDLVPAVLELVDHGIKVHLWDVCSSDSRIQQSPELLALADQRHSLPLSDLAPFVELAAPVDRAAASEAGPPGGVTTDALMAKLGPPPLRQLDPQGLRRSSPDGAAGDDSAQFGIDYGRHWAEEAGPALVEQFFEVARRPGLPRLIDHDLLKVARENDLAVDDEDVRHQLRDGFWRAVDTARERTAVVTEP